VIALPQILGSIFGSLIYTGLIPGLHLLEKEFQGGIAPGCFGPAVGVTKSMVRGYKGPLQLGHANGFLAGGVGGQPRLSCPRPCKPFCPSCACAQIFGWELCM
jgi:hypothetical protein